MKVSLIGLGCGTADTVTAQARRLLNEAQCIIGAKRLLDSLPGHDTAKRVPATKPQEILELLQRENCDAACVVYSGDTGFYSGARLLFPLLREHAMEVQVLPGISSIQALAARLGRPWQDWSLVSAHGTLCDAVAAVCGGRPVCFLTGSVSGSPGALCQQLAEVGLGELPVTVGENLTCPEEQIFTGTAGSFAGQTFAPLSLLLAEPAPHRTRRTPGIPDEAFVRGKTPMTKQEVRAAILAKLAVGPDDLCWDIGAGTGSVSVELSLQARSVWAVEAQPEAIALIRENRTRFGAWNLRLVEGWAPEALGGLPKPDAVFVGGSGGELFSILGAIHRANPTARVCVSALALETLQTAFTTLSELGYEVEVCQIGVSRTKPAGALHLLMAQNPVFLITGVVE